VAALLLIQPRWLGDVLLCTPAIRAARHALPDARIDFLTEPGSAAVLEGNPHLDDVVVAEPGLRQLRLLRNVRRAAYDAVVDFRSTPSTALVTLATGAPVRVGLAGRGLRNRAYTHLLPKDRGQRYMARQKLAMLGPLGIDTATADASLHIEIGDAQRRRAREIWQSAGFDDEVPVVAVSAVSRIPYKQWGHEHWAAVADRLAVAGARILLTSGPGEREDAARTAALMAAPAVWDYGPTTVRELAALYQRCALWIGNDGGPKHIAAAAGTPTLTVIRWRIGAVWTLDDPRRRDLFIDAAPPGGCDLNCGRCAHLGCLGEVQVEAVAARARTLLDAGG
jgi:heptosyltransferase III